MFPHHHKTKDGLLTDLWASPEVNASLSKIYPENLREDIRSDVFAVLCEYSLERLEGIIAKGSLSRYAMMMIHHRATSKNNSFYRKIRRCFDELDEDTTDPGTDEVYPDEYFTALANIDEWEMRVLEAVVEHGSMKEASEALKMPYSQLTKMVYSARETMEIALRKKVKMFIQIDFPIELVVLKQLDTDQVQEMIDSYKREIVRRIKDVGLNDFSQIWNPHRSEPKIKKIRYE